MIYKKFPNKSKGGTKVPPKNEYEKRIKIKKVKNEKSKNY